MKTFDLTPPHVRYIIGIPTLNRKDLLIEGLREIAHLNCPKVIIDNGQQNLGSLPGFDIYEEPVNLGVAKSWNRFLDKAFRQYRADWCILLNDDVVTQYTDELLEQVIAEAPENAGVITSSYYWSVVLVNRKSFEQIGYFDEQFYPAYYEDNDYHRRLTLAGWVQHTDTRLDPVVKRNSMTLAKDPSINALFERNKKKYVDKWGGEPGAETFTTPYDKQAEQRKLRLLIYTDSPYTPSGFGMVCKELVTNLKDIFDITVVGISDDRYHWNPIPGIRVIPAIDFEGAAKKEPDYYGFSRLEELFRRETFDRILTINDMTLIEACLPVFIEARSRWNNGCKLVGYWPVDSEQLSEWMAIQCMYDKNVFYTLYGVENGALDSKEAVIIPHGIAPVRPGSNGKGVSADVKRYLKAQFFGEQNADRRVIINVNRNQPRKNIVQTVAAFDEMRNKSPEYCDALLYLHMLNNDKGGNLEILCKQYGLTAGEDVMWPESADVSAATLQGLYRASDVFITTTHGEGWGLTITEALQAGLPVVAPDNSCIPEVLGENKEFMYNAPDVIYNGAFDLFRHRFVGKTFDISEKLLAALDAVCEMERSDVEFSNDLSHLLTWPEVAARFAVVLS